MGDVLGAPVEGWPASKISREVGEVCKPLPGTHMGIREEGNRMGFYTDDTNCTFALVESLIENKGNVDSGSVARQYARYARLSPRRGYPASSLEIVEAIYAGVHVDLLGTLRFKEGKFSNGGAMKIAPLGLVHFLKSDGELYDLVRRALIPTHTHANAIDAAFIMAKAVALLAACAEPRQASLSIQQIDDVAIGKVGGASVEPSAPFNPKAFLKVLSDTAETLGLSNTLQRRLRALHRAYGRITWGSIVLALGVDDADRDAEDGRGGGTTRRHNYHDNYSGSDCGGANSSSGMISAEANIAGSNDTHNDDNHDKPEDDGDDDDGGGDDDDDDDDDDDSPGARVECYGVDSLGFQIQAVVCVPCVLWAFCDRWCNPVACLSGAIALGGDTDTIASMVGSLLGVLWGPGWVPPSWTKLVQTCEKERGPEFCKILSEQLSVLVS